MTDIRLSEVVMALSLATDLGTGRPMEWALSTAIIGLRLADALNLSEADRHSVYYLSLLKYVGCTSGIDQTMRVLGDDPAAASIELARIEPEDTVRMLRWIVRRVGAGQPIPKRVATLLNLTELSLAISDNHCEAAAILAARLGMPPDVRHALSFMYERWDGKGEPKRLSGEAIPLAMRVVHVVQDAEALRRSYGLDEAVTVVRRRSGTAYEPRIAEEFCRRAASLCADTDTLEWDSVARAEPGQSRWLNDDEFDAAALVFADFIDLYSPGVAGHSRAVGDLAANAARISGLPAADVQAVRRMGWLHDIGKIGVLPSIWAKDGPLTAMEWERVRLHPYYTERILSRPAALGRLGVVAAQHHERPDGSGYPKGLRSDGFTPLARILAAANFYSARREIRPHRPALTAEQGADAVRQAIRAGHLDRDAGDAVLSAAGHRVAARRDSAAGLTEREIEVLRLIARGMSNKQTAQALSVSEKTVGNHIMHIYEKAGIRTRAAAALFAMQHGFLSED